MALTRLSMIPAASSTFSGVTFSPEAVFASRVIRVPPCRSSPSFGFQVSPSATPAYNAATTSPNTMSVRPGRRAFFATACVLLG